MRARPIFQLRRQQGEFHNLLQEMRMTDSDNHFKYLRMSKERFDDLLSQVSDINSVLDANFTKSNFRLDLI